MSLINFEFSNAHVRTFMDGENVWFVAKDVCDVLGHGNPSQAIVAAQLQDSEKADIILNDTSSNGVSQARTYTAISESGLYALILTSRKENARAFQRWVTQEVLPTLRKTGSYSLSGEANEPTLEEILLDHLPEALHLSTKEGQSEARRHHLDYYMKTQANAKYEHFSNYRSVKWNIPRVSKLRAQVAEKYPAKANKKKFAAYSERECLLILDKGQDLIDAATKDKHCEKPSLEIYRRASINQRIYKTLNLNSAPTKQEQANNLFVLAHENKQVGTISQTQLMQ